MVLTAPEGDAILVGRGAFPPVFHNRIPQVTSRDQPSLLTYPGAIDRDDRRGCLREGERTDQGGIHRPARAGNTGRAHRGGASKPNQRWRISLRDIHRRARRARGQARVISQR